MQNQARPGEDDPGQVYMGVTPLFFYNENC